MDCKGISRHPSSFCSYTGRAARRILPFHPSLRDLAHKHMEEMFYPTLGLLQSRQSRFNASPLSVFRRFGFVRWGLETSASSFRLRDGDCNVEGSSKKFGKNGLRRLVRARWYRFGWRRVRILRDWRLLQLAGRILVQVIVDPRHPTSFDRDFALEYPEQRAQGGMTTDEGT